jgi:AcrR family transcriptional regulator
MDEIASRAGTSKTVLYRHFGDRAGLYAAVVESVHVYIERRLTAVIEQQAPGNLDKLAGTLADAYLAVVEQDPHIYRFVMNGPTPGAGGGDPLGASPSRIGNYITSVIKRSGAGEGVTDACAATWGYGLVGFIRAVVDRWMDSPDPEPREDIVNNISRLFSAAFAVALQPQEVLATPPDSFIAK